MIGDHQVRQFDRAESAGVASDDHTGFVVESPRDQESARGLHARHRPPGASPDRRRLDRPGRPVWGSGASGVLKVAERPSMICSSAVRCTGGPLAVQRQQLFGDHRNTGGGRAKRSERTITSPDLSKHQRVPAIRSGLPAASSIRHRSGGACQRRRSRVPASPAVWMVALMASAAVARLRRRFCPRRGDHS